MADPLYTPTNAEAALAHLVEECGEVLAAAGKTFRFGPNSVNLELPAAEQETNLAWLLREMADLDRAMLVFRSQIDALVNPPALDAGRDAR